MVRIGIVAWWRHRDPALATAKSAVRVTVAATIGFYVSRYALHNTAMATYALFGAVALGALAQLTGSAWQRARTLLLVLPAGCLLVTAGTLLAVTNWAAALGMFVLGFLVSYIGVGGPRLVGLAGGAQLLYILPCFPPFAPATLGYRLAGLALAVALLAGTQLLLWPERAPLPYRRRLGDAVGTVADCLAALAATLDGEPGGRTRLAAALPATSTAAESVRPMRLPNGERPASAGRRDRALSDAAGSLRRAVAAIVEMFRDTDPDPLTLPATARLLHRAASAARDTGGWLRGEASAPDLGAIGDALADFRTARLMVVPDGVHPDRLRLGSLALAVGETVRALATAARVAGGAPVGPDPTPPSAQPSQFVYAYRSDVWLWWQRLREHLTPRSVHFQGAVRLSVALAAARLLAGVLDVSHGFWVLLATLTLLRTSAVATRRALGPVLAGTALGAVLAGAVLAATPGTPVYVVALPLVMLLGFGLGPLVGAFWSQALFTLMIAMVFAQVAPVNWQLAEARLLDVLLGAGVGVVIALLAWPRGGSGELHLAAANFLAGGARVVRETVEVLVRAAPRGPALPSARRLGEFAEASYALYQTERHPASSAMDWQATLGAGHHAVRGAETLLNSCPGGRLVRCAHQLEVTAAAVASGYERFAAALARRDRPGAAPAALAAVRWPTNLGTDLYHLADLRVWLSTLDDDLIRIAAGETEPAGPAVRVRA